MKKKVLSASIAFILVLSTIFVVYASRQVGAQGGGNPGLGWELLNESKVLHVWNQHNSYYFNVSNGVQFSNHYEEYWTTNVLMAGYYAGDEWNLIYRVDELSGFERDVEVNETYLNATLWKNLAYAGYNFRLAIRYHLGINDSDLTVIPYIKNLGQAIPFTLGFGWELKDIRIANVLNDNYLKIYNGTSFEMVPLNQTLDRNFTNMDYNTTINLVCTNPPTQHISRNLYLSWNRNLTYKVTCKSRVNQYNAPTTLFIRVGTLGVGQEKSTEMHWLDSDDWLGIGSSEYDSHCGDTDGHTLQEALDGDDYWYHAVDEQHWFILDLGSNYTVRKMRGRSNYIADPTDVDVFVSMNKTDWGTAVATAINTWQDTAAWVEVDTTDKEGRYIKVVIEDTEAGTNHIRWGQNPLLSPISIFDVYGDVSGYYYFNSYASGEPGEAWETNPGDMVDGSQISTAQTTAPGDIELCNGNTCPGNDIGTITKVEIRVKGHYNFFQSAADIRLRPVFSGGDGDNHDFDCSGFMDWSPLFDITTDTNAPNPWTWADVANLECDVEALITRETILYCSIVTINVTYTTAVSIIFDINRSSFSFGTIQANTVAYSNETQPNTFTLYNNGTCSIDIDINGTNATGSGISDWVLSGSAGDNLYAMCMYNSSVGWVQIKLTQDTWYENMAQSTSMFANINISTPTVFYSGNQMTCTIYMWASVH